MEIKNYDKIKKELTELKYNSVVNNQSYVTSVYFDAEKAEDGTWTGNLSTYICGGWMEGELSWVTDVGGNPVDFGDLFQSDDPQELADYIEGGDNLLAEFRSRLDPEWEDGDASEFADWLREKANGNVYLDEAVCKCLKDDMIGDDEKRKMEEEAEEELNRAIEEYFERFVEEETEE